MNERQLASELSRVQEIAHSASFDSGCALELKITQDSLSALNQELS